MVGPKVLFIKAPCYSDAVSPPLGLGYLAWAIRDLARVRIADGVLLELGPGKITALVKKEAPDLIGFSVVSSAWENAASLIRAARAAAPNSFIIAGGPHPTLASKDFLEKTGPALDAVVQGEAELRMAQMVSRLEPGMGREAFFQAIDGIPGVCVYNGPVLLHDPANNPPDLSVLGRPLWEILPPASYPRSPHGAFSRLRPVAPVITSRGCSYDCGFCGVPAMAGHHLRFRPPEMVVEEMKLLRDRFGVRELQIIDDNFTFQKKHALAICERMLREGVVLPWSLPNGLRVDSLDDELLDAMKESGCYSVSMGLESGSPRVLKSMNKRLDLSRLSRAVEMVAAKNMAVNGFFLLGFPGETPADIRETIRLAKSLPLTMANFSLFTPLPGSPMGERLMAAGPDRPPTVFSKVGYVPEGLRASQLKAMQRKAFLDFYLRPKSLKNLGRMLVLSGREGGAPRRGARPLSQAAHDAGLVAENLYYFMRRAANWLL